MANKITSSAIARAVSKNFDEQTDFLSSLVKAKSPNPHTPQDSSKDDPIEKEVAELIYGQLKDFGLSPRRKGLSKKRYNVLCEWGNKRARKSLMLNGHMDTIPPDEKAVLNPYSGSVRGGKMYGLGVLDMKATLTAYIYALKALMDLKAKSDGKLILAFVVDEESGGCSRYGTQHLLEYGITAKAAIIGEPGTNTVGIGHRGGYRFKVIVKGESVHTGIGSWERGEKGKNAAVDMAKVITSLQGMEIPYKQAKAFASRKPVMTFPTKLLSGHAVNVVPGRAEAWGDVRLMPGNSDKQVKMLIIERLQRLGVDFEIEDLLFVPSIEIDHREELVEVLRAEAKEVLGKTPVLRGVGPWNDAWMLVKRDIPTICGFGPDGGGEHGAEEYVQLKSLKEVTEIYARTILSYLG